MWPPLWVFIKKACQGCYTLGRLFLYQFNCMKRFSASTIKVKIATASAAFSYMFMLSGPPSPKIKRRPAHFYGVPTYKIEILFKKRAVFKNFLVTFL